jgi:flavin reductase (DIM6/NTAB) family NADH-FMN oxidoreductase RutF
MKQSATRFSPRPETGRDLRRVFGRFGTGVTVVTTQSDQGPLGMTANSFTSVSLDPALVLWSVAVSSKRHDAFVRCPHFAIHVLGADQSDLAQHFAAQGLDFADLDWAPGPNQVPNLQGCIATLHCETQAVQPAGDHSLVIARVLLADLPETNMPGLMFERGRFGQISG